VCGREYTYPHELTPLSQVSPKLPFVTFDSLQLPFGCKETPLLVEGIESDEKMST
jgi:hypothetical protein